MEAIIKISTTEAEALYLLAKDMERKMSMLQIAKETGKHYPNVFKAVKSLAKKGIIKTETFGKATACSLDKESPLLPALLAFIEEQKSSAYFNRMPFLARIAKEAGKLAPECAAGIFGSHAEGTATAKSDIDFFIIADSQNIKRFRQFIPRFFPEYEGKVHLAAISFAEFSESISSKEYSVGKEIAKKGVVFRGGESFYQARMQ
ncbi:MAG: nucleotidyltransferase domain-containing protein [Nanoarchaeota archaeon]|nr:nucleotidyltransferase domain-containing protein [Nanoarchaeota archaeon]